MRNYDEIRAQNDMTFVICGQTFTLGPCSAMQYAEWEKAEDAVEQNGASTAEIIIGLTNRVLLDLMSAEDGKRWKTLIKRKDGPTIAELSDLRQWVIETQTDLPTMRPASSEAGPSQTKDSSKGA